jgi:Fe-S cluster biogenesis protein NfuA
MDKTLLTEKVVATLELIRPYLQADGGDVNLSEITDDMVVKVRLSGACVGCPFSIQTLRAGVEQALRKEIPEIKEVVAIE